MTSAPVPPVSSVRDAKTVSDAANGRASPHGSAKPARRSQEERSREARDRLLAATIDVLMEKGYNGLTTKEVAKRAGLSNGALMHHFATKAELVVAATAAVYDVFIERGQRVAKSPEALKDPVQGFITDCLSVYFDWPFLAALEVIVVARTDPELMARILPVMQRYRSTTNELWLKVFSEAGMSRKDADRVLNLSLNLVRGMAVNRMWQHDEVHYRQYLKDWTRIIKSRLADK